MIRALSGHYRLKDLLAVSGVPASTYHYNLHHPARRTRGELWDKVIEIFHRTANGMGHRQIAMCLRAEDGVRIADKTVLKIMHEIGLRCGIRRERPYHRYNSYRGDIGRKPDNLLQRDFQAARAWEKMGTDVTEFRLGRGKAYLAPVYDFASKEIIAWSISEHPGMAQQDEMLDMLFGKMPEGAHPILHSDQGWQYQHDHYQQRLREAGIVQSMSRKGNCLDNAATEQVFGHLKDEFYKNRKFRDFDTFKRELDSYIVYWNTQRRQKKLEGLTPAEYRHQALAA